MPIQADSIVTPFHRLEALTRFLDGPRLMVKRDDLTPFGGSKFRKAMVIVEQALEKGASVVVSEGSIESQHARSLAIAAQKRGLSCVLVLSPEVAPDSTEPTLLDDSAGAEVLLADCGSKREVQVRDVVQDLIARGEVPELVPFSGTTPATAIAYAEAFKEMMRQAEDQSVRIDGVFVSSATGGIQAGLELGKRILPAKRVQISGVSPGFDRDSLVERILKMIRSASEVLNLNVPVAPADIIILDQYIGDGYLQPTRESREAQRLVLDLEGLQLDSVYTAKTMAALIDQIHRQRYSRSQTLVFWHSAG